MRSRSRLRSPAARRMPPLATTSLPSASNSSSCGSMPRVGNSASLRRLSRRRTAIQPWVEPVSDSVVYSHSPAGSKTA